MNQTIKIPVIKAKQPIGEVYVAKMNAVDLLRMSSVDRRHIEDDDEIIGIQRPLKKDKIRAIKRYLTKQSATFPNSIIVNVKNENVINISDTEIELKDSDDTFTIIDGQHRLYGFDDYHGQEFELIITIFIGLDTALQSEVFSIINSQQTKVDPSLNINLELADKTETPTKKLVQIAQTFNIDKESPWYQRIKMLGSQSEGVISLAAFVRPLFDMTFPERMLIDIKNELNKSYPSFPMFSNLVVNSARYPFWTFYVSQDPSMIYKILLNYFRAFRAVLSSDWMSEDSILNKTSGYNAMIKLLQDILPIGIDRGDLTESFFTEILEPLSKLSGYITSDIYGSSGLYSSNNLYKDMRRELRFE
jgi:DGQHR domain-containing protein